MDPGFLTSNLGIANPRLLCLLGILVEEEYPD